MAVSSQGAPLNDQIAQKIDKKEVACFLKDYNRSYDTKFERNFPFVKLYTKEEVTAKKANPSFSLTVIMDETNMTETATPASAKEKQLFSPGTKKVVDELANTTGVETFGVVKRGITFAQPSSAPQSIVPAEKAISPPHEDATPALADGSPIKKSKNLLKSK